MKREAIELPSNFTMTINAELKVGALEETLTVTGASPIVDVQSTTKSQVLNRDALDAIPTGRTIQGMGQLITGVSLNIPDVGGSRAMQQTYMSAHGARRVADDGAGGRPDGQRPRRRRRGAELLQQLDEPGNGLHDQRRRRLTCRAAACGST